MSLIGEFENIWRTIEYGNEKSVQNILRDEDFVKSVMGGLNIYKTPGGSPSADKIKNDPKVTSIDKSTALRFSALSGLNEQQSLDLFRKCQTVINDKLRTHFLDVDMENDGETNPVILSNLLRVFHKDRIYLLKIINAVILQNKGRETRKLLGENFLDNLLEQFENLLKTNPVPPRSRDLNSETISAMHLQHLREKCFLCETLLLSVIHLKPSAKSVDKFFYLSKKYFFLLNTSSSYLVDSVVADKLKEFSVVLLQLILIKITTQEAKADGTKTLIKANKMILELLLQSETRILAPLQLTWAMVHFLHAENFGAASDSVIEKLSSISFQSSVWPICRIIMGMPQATQSVVESDIFQIILDFVDLVLQHIDPESAGGTAELCETISCCLNNEMVANKFWEHFIFYDEKSDGVASLINYQIGFLPLDFEITFKLLSSMSSSPVGRTRIVELLDRLKYLSELISGEETDDEILTNDEGSIWTLRQEKLIAGFNVKEGTTGELFQSSLGAVVQWKLPIPVNGWTLVDHFLDVNFNGEIHQDLTISILKMYTNFKCHDLPMRFGGFETLFKHVINNYNHYEYYDVIYYFIDTISSLDIYLTKKLLPGSPLFSEILAQEKENCNYKNIVKIVGLLTDLCKKNEHNLAVSIEYVIDEIFGSHLGWKYSSLYQKVELSIALLKLVFELLSQDSKIKNVITELFRRNEAMCRVVVTLACLKSDEIDDTTSTSEYFTSLLVQQVSIAFSILELILEQFQDDKNSKIIKLLTQRSDNDSVCGFILKSVSGFIIHKSNTELPFVALRLLGRLCHFDQISLNATLGSYVFQLRNNILEKILENERFQNSVIDLLATIAEYQPSLLEIFVDLIDDKENPGEKKIGPNSCLPVILDLLKQNDDATVVNVSNLESGFRFLHALWGGRKDSHKYFKVLRILRARKQFWSSVFAPFYQKNNVIASKAVLTAAHSFAVISHEYYFATTLNADYEAKLNRFVNHDNILTDWSIFIISAVEKLCSSNLISSGITKENAAIKASLISLVKSWRCFWSVFAPGKELKNAQKMQFVIDGIYMTLILLERASDQSGDQIRDILLLMTSTSLTNLAKLANLFSSEQKNIMLDNLYKGLKYIRSDSGLIYDDSVIIDILSMISVILSTCSQGNEKIQQILKLSSSFINTNNHMVQIITSRIIQQTFKILKTNEWLSEISTNNIFQSIITLLSQVISTRTDNELGTALCSLLITVSDNAAVVNHFIRLSLLSPLILASENLYLPLTESSDNEWPKLYRNLTLLQLQLLKTLGPLYINDALDWTGVHQRRFEFILRMAGRENSSQDVLNETNVILMFLIKVSDYKGLWIQTVGQGGSSAAECLQAAAKLLVTIPRLFNDTKLSIPNESENDKLSREYIRILISSFQILSKFSAPIMQILLDEGLDSGQYQNIIQPNLQNALIGEMPTYSSCLSCLSLGIMFLEKSSKSSNEIDVNRPEVVLLIDQSIQLILSQASLLFMNSEPSRELDQFKNYLGAELSDNILSAQRHFPYFKQNWSPSMSPSASPRSSREWTPLRRSKSNQSEGNIFSRDGEHGMLLIADQFKKEILC